MLRPARGALAVGGLALVVGLSGACDAGQSQGPSTAASSEAGQAQQLPACRRLAEALLRRVYQTARVSAKDAVDDRDRSERLCTFDGRMPNRGDGRFTVVVSRLFADSYEGMPRRRWLRSTAAASVKSLCDSEPRTPAGFEWAISCYTPASHGGRASIGVVSGDTKVVVHGGGLSDDEPGDRFRDRAERDVLAVAKALLDAVDR